MSLIAGLALQLAAGGSVLAAAAGVPAGLV